MEIGVAGLGTTGTSNDGKRGLKCSLSLSRSSRLRGLEADLNAQAQVGEPQQPKRVPKVLLRADAKGSPA